MKKYLGEIALLITAIIWGSGFVASAVALDHYSPYQMMAIRFLVGGVILLVFFFKKLKQLNRVILLKGIFLGTILYIAFALQTVGLQFTTPSKNAFLTAVNVVIVPFIGYLIYKKRLDRFELVGAFLAMTGVGLLSLQDSFKLNIGDSLSLLCAVAFAFHIFYTAKYVNNEDPILLTLVQLLTAAVIGIVVIIFKGEGTMAMDKEALLPVLYLGIFSTTIAFILQTSAQKYISETKAAIFLSTESLFGMIFSVIILNEIVTTKMVLGAVIILFAIILSETKLGLAKLKVPLSNS
ncbi:DMT family transporter [Lederbergia wuyishanensis]|uniref:Drug/metabolite transporter (DMT)-like permease n=1 Tax=Lederbergia wuyishanensis TaxID=1347903 RepID=A0ABU0D9S8_9BACI|nr:DMT family transporter [Lederbergia wuyishanensis]MCJ8007422.1 DMT family transporter [Lederbergia wuyishanensis]MDQ0345140.1 drug/metabolite transporter (DMT)-like permease [Lederbergia wuyishanensis]